MTKAVHNPCPSAVALPSSPIEFTSTPFPRMLNLQAKSGASYGAAGHPPYNGYKQITSHKSHINPDTPLPVSPAVVLIAPLLLYLLYLIIRTRQFMHKQNRNQHTQMQKQREQYENEANKLHHQIQHLDEHIGRLKTEQILREKQVLQLRNRLEQREKLLDRFTAELLPASLNIPDLSAAARNLQQACRTAELSARFDNKLLQRLPPSFERALSQLHPGLSEQDIRLAGYLFLNLPNKEIAQIRSISDAGVSKSRNRLRKKLGLRPEQDLTLFMRSLTDSQPEEELNRLADQILHINHPDQPPFTSTKHQANEILNLSTPYNQHKSAA